MIILNNPHNPTGRLFDRAELEAVAAVAERHDLLVLSDEVWEQVLLTKTPPPRGEVAAKPTEGEVSAPELPPPSGLRFATSPDGEREVTSPDFTPFATLPNMAHRTLKCGSAGKIFSLTGWKIGWLIAPSPLVAKVARAHQFLTFATATPLQAAVAFGLDHGDAWFPPMRAAFVRARDRLVTGLGAAGYVVLLSEATYFACVDLAASGITEDDRSFADRAVAQAGVAVIPLSPRDRRRRSRSRRLGAPHSRPRRAR